MDRSPDDFPLTVDLARGAQVVRLDEAAYRQASFLDERLAATTGPGRWVSWAQLEEAAAGLPAQADFIFHLGHVGSTLLARLLGVSPRIFSLREPAALRVFAQVELDLGAPGCPWTPAEFDARLASLLRLLSRTYAPGQRALIKATSQVSELAPAFRRLIPSARTILMYVAPEPYLATILAGPNSRTELSLNAPARLRRLNRRLGAAPLPAGDLSPGELAAMAWACQGWSLADAASAFGRDALWIDFEAFLARPAAHLSAALAFLHGQADESAVAAMIASPDLRRYAKAPEYAYDAQLRRDVLAAARREHAAEIARGMAWINAAGRGHPALAAAIRTVAAAPRIV